MFGMPRSLKQLHGFKLHASDGEIGSVNDTLWDDAQWILRYLVIDTGHWLTGRRVLISPASIQSIDWTEGTIMVNLSCDQVRNSPPDSSDEPVSRQYEEALSAYYGWPSYWTIDPFGYEPMSLPVALPTTPYPKPRGDPHLRSTHDVIGYGIEARDGEIGHVADLLIEDAGWRISDLIVDTGSWLHKRRVVVSTHAVTRILWDESRVVVDETQDSIAHSPAVQ